MVAARAPRSDRPRPPAGGESDGRSWRAAGASPLAAPGPSSGTRRAPRTTAVASSGTARASSLITLDRSAELGSTEDGSVAHRAY